MSFQANGQEAQAATAQHLVVGWSGTGLNVDPTFDWANRDVTATNTMKISEHTKVDTSKLIEKFWGVNNKDTWLSNVPSSFGAVRQLYCYGGLVPNRRYLNS